jgi:hypothetical protein
MLIQIYKVKSTGFKFMMFVKCLFRNYIAVVSSLIFISFFVTAQEHIPFTPEKFIADPGIYDPITFGDNITFNACNSSFEDFSICELSSLTGLRLEWRATPQGQDPLAAGTLIASFANNNDISQTEGATENTVIGNDFHDGINFTIDSGEASAFFPTPGDYSLHLTLFFHRRVGTVQLPNGDFVGPLPGAVTRQTETVINFTAAPIAPPTTVPEPVGYLILIPAFYMIARRQRKLSQTKASSIA